MDFLHDTESIAYLLFKVQRKVEASSFTLLFSLYCCRQAFGLSGSVYTGEFKASMKDLAAASGFSVRTMIKGIRELERTGILRVIRRRGGGNFYRFLDT